VREKGAAGAVRLVESSSRSAQPMPAGRSSL
jgi:hypothetical protein